MKKFWFKSKTYGYGWYPASWQGWVVLIVYLLALLGAYFLFLHGPITHPGNKQEIPAGVWEFFACEIVLTIVLICIAYKTGEKAGWRWGKKDKDKK
jgi:hypothetical protein